MQRRKLIAGNWKMNGVRGDLPAISEIALAAASHPEIDVALGLPFTLIEAGVAAAPGRRIATRRIAARIPAASPRRCSAISARNS
jgi:triosephosphate isomerase